MAKLTNAQLAAENAALRMECNTLRTQMQNMASVASAVNTMQQPAWREEANERRRWMNEARRCAIESGRMCKV